MHLTLYTDVRPKCHSGLAFPSKIIPIFGLYSPGSDHQSLLLCCLRLPILVPQALNVSPPETAASPKPPQSC